MGLASFNRRRRQLLKSEVTEEPMREVGEVTNAIGYEGMTKDKLSELLSEKGIEHNPRDKKEDLYNLLLLCENEDKTKGN